MRQPSPAEPSRAQPSPAANVQRTRWTQVGDSDSFLVGELPAGKRSHNYGKSPFLISKSTISMAIFNSYVCLPEGSSLVAFHQP